MRVIDADALIKYCNEKWIPLNIDAVKAQPTIKSERKRGKWEEKSTFDVDENGDRIIDEWQSARCSVCGKYHTTPYMYYFDVYNFCPNCGADMRGE